MILVVPMPFASLRVTLPIADAKKVSMAIRSKVVLPSDVEPIQNVLWTRHAGIETVSILVQWTSLVEPMQIVWSANILPNVDADSATPETPIQCVILSNLQNVFKTRIVPQTKSV